MPTKVIFHIHIVRELDELLDGADMSSIRGAVQGGEVPFVPHIHLAQKSKALPAHSGVHLPFPDPCIYLCIGDRKTQQQRICQCQFLLGSSNLFTVMGHCVLRQQQAHLVLQLPDEDVYEICPALLCGHMHSCALVCAAYP